MLKCRSGDDFNTAHIYAQNIDSMHCNRRDNTTNVYFDAILLSCVLCVCPQQIHFVMLVRVLLIMQNMLNKHTLLNPLKWDDFNHFNVTAMLCPYSMQPLYLNPLGKLNTIHENALFSVGHN